MRAQGTVSWSKGAIRFLLGLGVAIFIGGAIRSVASPRLLGRLLHEHAFSRLVGFDFQAQDLSLSLASGMRPELGVRAHRLAVASAEPCGWQNRLVLHDVTATLAVVPAVFRGQVNLKGLRVDRAEVVADERCPEPSPESSDDPPERSESEADHYDFLTRLVHDLSLHLEGVGKIWGSVEENLPAFVKVISVRELKWSPKGRADFFNLRNVRIVLDTADRVLQASGQWDQNQGPISVSVRLSPQTLEWQARGHVGEGRMQLLATLQHQTQNFVVHMEARHLPLHQWPAELRRVGIQDFGRLQAWLQCQSEASGQLRDFSNAMVKIGACEIQTSAGVIAVLPDEWRIREYEKGQRALQFLLKNIDLDRLFSYFGHAKPIEWLPTLGTFTGGFKLFPSGQGQMSGHVDGMEAFLMRRGQALRQRVNRLAVKLERGKDFSQMEVQGLELEGGRWVGGMTWAGDLDWAAGRWTFAVDEIRFREEFARPFFDGDVGSIRLSGFIELDERRRWQAGKLTVQAPTWQGPNGRLTDIQIQAEGRAPQLILEIRSGAGAWAGPGRVLRLLRPVLHQLETETRDVEFAGAQLKLVTEESGRFHWREANLRVLEPQVLLSSARGELTPEQIAGSIVAKWPNKKNELWRLSGPATQPTVTLEADSRRSGSVPRRAAEAAGR